MQDNPSAKLSPRQRQVLELIRQGKSNNEIAFALGIGLGTVKQHVVALFRKLKVTSRTKALTRPAAEERPAVHSPTNLSEDILLERRPCVVLSLALDTDNPNLHRALKRNVASIAQETGDIFISWRGAGCDLILGVDQASETDCLRALHGAWKTAQAIHHEEPTCQLKGAVATGLAVASMFRHGGWSGEVMASSAIALARNMAIEAPIGSLQLDVAFLDLLRLCGADLAEVHRNQVPLGAPHVLQWGRRENPASFLGRKAELARLTALLETSSPGPHVLFGPPGSGKTRICMEFAHRAHAGKRMVRLVRCLPPQAPAPFLDTSSVTAWNHDTFLLHLGSLPKNELLILDDTHWLSEGDRDLFRNPEPSGSIAMLFTDRGAREGAAQDSSPDEPAWVPESKALHLEPLSTPTITDLVTEAMAFGPTSGSGRAKMIESITLLAAGNPRFALELARNALRTQGPSASPDNLRHLPPSILTMIRAKLDRLALDRRMLRVIAAFPEGIAIGELARALGEPKDSLPGGIAKAKQYNILAQENSDHVRFAHPMVRHVVHHLGMES
ncbi:MAG: hypothetical protein EA399_15170 [Desulfovibrionales bacterium]|nr:MAG: hypothetical protein EA399_15170 [Desulfovibrionales bacterium]